MATVTIEEAQSHLPALIAGLQPGEELLITQHDVTVAKLTLEIRKPPSGRLSGTAAGQLTILADDDDHLADFAEYMP